MKKFWKSPWTKIITPVVLGFLLTIVYDLIKEKQIFSAIGKIIVAIWNGIIAFLTFDLKVWWVILVAALFLFVFYIKTQKSKSIKDTPSKEMPPEEKPPEFLTYKEDRFKTWKWSWDWYFNRLYKSWEIEDIKAHCPKCDTPMIPYNSESIFQCPRCDFESQYNKHERSDEVKVVIIDNINRKYMK